MLKDLKSYLNGKEFDSSNVDDVIFFAKLLGDSAVVVKLENKYKIVFMINLEEALEQGATLVWAGDSK